MVIGLYRRLAAGAITAFQIEIYSALFADRSRIDPIRDFLDYGMNVVEETNAAEVNDEVTVELLKYPREDNGSTFSDFLFGYRLLRIKKRTHLQNVFRCLGYALTVSGTRILEGTEINVRVGAVLNITCDVYIGRRQNYDFASTLDPSNPIRNLSLIWLHNNQVRMRTSVKLD